MKKTVFSLLILTLFISSSGHAGTGRVGAVNKMEYSYIDYSYNGRNVKLRVGVTKENEEFSFRGHVLYYQGLADSIANQRDLFEEIASYGFRVIAFDYMGQGGSQGSMNDTTIAGINQIGKIVAEKFKKTDCTQNCDSLSIVGWSTGGLAAYRDAYFDAGKHIKKVALIAPGIVPRYVVGEGIWNSPPLEISPASLYSGGYEAGKDPHVEAIKPKNPVNVTKFVTDLLSTAKNSRHWYMTSNVKGVVLIAGDDSFVNGKKTLKAVQKTAPHFRTVMFKNSRHEIHNEKKYWLNAYNEILQLLLE